MKTSGICLRSEVESMPNILSPLCPTLRMILIFLYVLTFGIIGLPLHLLNYSLLNFSKMELLLIPSKIYLHKV